MVLTELRALAVLQSTVKEGGKMKRRLTPPHLMDTNISIHNINEVPRKALPRSAEHFGYGRFFAI